MQRSNWKFSYPKPSNGIPCALIILLLASQHLVTAAKTTSPPARYTYTNAAADFSTLALIVNGIALEQGLTDGSVNRTEMINELLNLKVSLDEMETENVLGLTDELNGIGSAVEKGCAGGKCLDTKAVQDGVAVLKQIKSLSLDQARAALDGPLKLLVQARQIYKVIKDAEAATEFLNDLLGELSDVEEDNEEELSRYARRVLYEADKVLDTRSKSFKQSFKAVKEDKTSKYSFSENVDTVISLGTQTSSISSKKGLLTSMSSELTKASSLASSLKTLLTSEKMSSLENKLRLASAIGTIGSASPKKWTSGFFNGYSDIKNLSSVWDTSFVRKVLAPDIPTQRLTRFFSGVIKEAEAMKPLQNIFESQDSLSKVQLNISRVLQWLNGSLTEVDSLKLLGDIQKCIPSGDLATSFDSKGWDAEKALLNTLANGAAEFINLVKNSKASFTTTKLEDFFEAVEDDSYKTTFANIKAFTTINEVTAELKALRPVLAALLAAPFKSYSYYSKLESLVKSTNTWMENEFLNFTQNFDANCSETSEDFLNSTNPQVPSISALLNLRPINLSPISSAISSLKAPLEAWQHFKTARKTREASIDPAPRLNDALVLSQDFSAGVKFVRDVEQVYLLRNELKFVLDAEQEIDRHIYDMYYNVSLEFLKSWKPRNLNLLRWLMDFLDEWTMSEPEKLTSFQPLLHQLPNYNLPEFNGKVLSNHLHGMQEPEGIQKALESIETLNLRKTIGRQVVPNAYWGLETLEKYFDQMRKKKKKPGVKRDYDFELFLTFYGLVCVGSIVYFIWWQCVEPLVRGEEEEEDPEEA